ncbi:MAG TPA: endonuclease/exonuclease/phosphatase family protein [Mycobacteriales bacterium]|nr:endonuclease/exonuclease/phosphatase family protein [Mycobacteriales bacterium]HVX70932.1 endonuclease/exonuclease/phosphatase family protein [Mycobacteriales bacterium]
MEFDPYEPYGALVDSTLRLITWNVWARFGNADARQRQLEDELTAHQPDIVCLTEAWAGSTTDQASVVADQLGHSDSRFLGARSEEAEWSSGIAITSRWPIAAHSHHDLTTRDGEVRGLLGHVEVDGPRGRIQVFGVMLDYPLGATAGRLHQVQQMLDVVAGSIDRRAITVLCGDFNAPPDSDEIRVLTGRSAGPGGLVFYDAWEVAGDGGPGITFARDNPLAAASLFPDRRFDYVFSAWPRGGGRGHPVNAQIVGRPEPPGPPASDHYGVLADLRY